MPEDTFYLEAPICGIKHQNGKNLSLGHPANRAGIRRIVEGEKRGTYPGGTLRRSDRIRLISELLRAASVTFLKEGRIASAIEVYLGTLRWNLELGRWRYLVALPILCAVEYLGIPAFRWRDSTTRRAG